MSEKRKGHIDPKSSEFFQRIKESKDNRVTQHSGWQSINKFNHFYPQISNFNHQIECCCKFFTDHVYYREKYVTIKKIVLRFFCTWAYQLHCIGWSKFVHAINKKRFWGFIFLFTSLNPVEVVNNYLLFYIFKSPYTHINSRQAFIVIKIKQTKNVLQLNQYKLNLFSISISRSRFEA